MNKDKKRGLLICFCGIDGSGKSTQIEQIARWLTSLNYDTIITKQPTQWYRNNRYVRLITDRKAHSEIVPVEMLALLSAADRIYHIKNVIEPNLQKGKAVLCDRYVFSAYASMMARGLDKLEWLKNINSFAITPDIIFLLDIPADIAIKRIMQRGCVSRKEEIDLNFLRKFRQVLLNLAKHSQETIIINGLKNKEEISLEIKKIISQILSKKIYTLNYLTS